MKPLDFDAEKYKACSKHQKEWGGKLLDSLALKGDEAVLDLGCGDGVLTARLAALVPRGFVLGIDASLAMIRTAGRLPAPGLSFELKDINQLDYCGQFDLIYSNATLHWILDHQKLLAAVHRALKPGGSVCFSFGGQGNCPALDAVLAEAMARPRYAGFFAGFPWPWFMPSVEEYRVLAGGLPFRSLEIWLENADRLFATAEEITGWIDQPCLVPFLRHLPPEARRPFRDDVVGGMLARTRRPGGFFEAFRRLNLRASI